MKEWGLTDKQVKQKSERLNVSEAVAFARRKVRIECRRRNTSLTSETLSRFNSMCEICVEEC